MITSVISKYGFRVGAMRNFEKEKQRAETRIILDNIGEAVITHSDNGIHFINKSAFKILTHCCNRLPLEIRQKCMAELKSL